MIIWKNRMNDYGLSDSVIIFLIFISVVSATAEVVSISIFLPIFELISQDGAEGLSNSNSSVVIYVQDFVNFFGLDLNVEVLLILSFVLFVISKLLLYVASYIQVYYTGLITKTMKDRLLDKYLQATPLFYDTVSIGDFTNSSSVELPVAVNGVIKPISLIITIVSGIGSVVLLLIMSIKLTFLSVFVVTVGAIIPYRWVKATVGAGKKNSHYGSVVTSFLIDRLKSPRLVRLSNTANNEKSNYSILTEKHRKLSLSIHNLKARINLVLEPIVVGISLIMFYLALEVLKMEVSTILLYMIVMVKLVPIITNILTQKQSINRALGPINSIDRLLSGMDANVDNSEKHISDKGLISRINNLGELKLEKIFYRYSGHANNALHDINYEFKKSTLIAIVGPSGGGKSTFVDIVSGYRQPTSGSIFINGVDKYRYSLHLLVSLVSYVPQSPQIFDGITIHEHIAYGSLESNRDDVINAAKLSGAYEFINEMPQGFDTVLSGSSLGLSGGQVQRIELSRALLRNTPLLILDEPTGNLDPISEKELMLNLKKIRESTEKIIIIIAHRISTIINADEIIVLESGKISGIGTHSDMILKNTWYNDAVSSN
jgi:ABC-type multidrug transport system fused ATPase/permease subunit